MKKNRFEQLLENVKEAVAIHQGKKYPEQVYRYELLDISKIRKTFGFSQAKFAAMLGISKRTLENWEQGTRKPTGAARRLLEVAARFPNAVYRTVFDREIVEMSNPDNSLTQVTTRPLSINGFHASIVPRFGTTHEEAKVESHLKLLTFDWGGCAFDHSAIRGIPIKRNPNSINIPIAEDQTIAVRVSNG